MLMISNLSKHLQALNADLKKQNWKTPEQAQFAGIVSILLEDIISELDGYFIAADSDRAQRDIISSCMDFTARWEVWLESTHFQAPASKVFHEQILRWVKGSLKAWRIWRIDSLK